MSQTLDRGFACAAAQLLRHARFCISCHGRRCFSQTMQQPPLYNSPIIKHDVQKGAAGIQCLPMFGTANSVSLPGAACRSLPSVCSETDVHFPSASP